MTTPLRGIGIHSGQTGSVRLHRDDGPLRFRLGGRAGTTVPATLAQVADTRRCVVLAEGGSRVAMVEHLLAALRVAGFWSGVLAEVEGPELPILDGSAAPYAAAVAELGPPPPAPAPLRPLAPVHWCSGASELWFEPGDEALEVEVDFDHPSIGRQRWQGLPADYPELLDARTFGFEHELVELQRRGLALGAVQGSGGILFADDGPRPPLRHPDEPVRHKALDALGDLHLLGRPLSARVRVVRGSHHAHVLAMRELLQHAAPEPS